MYGVERQSESFIWSVGDVIGSGATGTVYKCREKKKGKLLAAKVLNSSSEMRPYDVRMRETEVLRKLSHPNIVRLFALEKERGSGLMVIVMELCSKSLYEVIEEPENMNGLSDEDYIEVIRDISSGMEYLKANNVVHRDVKPGNILRSEKDNGAHVYKITDFGTARELGNTDQFTSYAYGTEEYLHPDLYERAVMRLARSGKKFDSTVDLWSLGVTFYHLATGELPFQPQGGRQNKEVMFRMITEKKPGVISCKENPNNNKLMYVDELPVQIQLSQALRRLITPILAGLLETNPDYMITHDEFFKRIRDIVERKSVDVYYTKNSLIYRLYLQQEDCYAHFHETMATELNVNLTKHVLMHNFREFKPDPMTPILHYPDFPSDNPLMLDTKEYVPAVDIPVKKIPIVQVNPRGNTFDDDAKLARLYSCLSYSIKRDTDKLLCAQKAILKAHNMFDFSGDVMFLSEKAELDDAFAHVQGKWKRLMENNAHLMKLHTAKNSHSVSGEFITDCDKRKYDTVVQVICKLKTEFHDIFENKVLSEEWNASSDKLLPWDNLITADVAKIRKIFVTFMEDRRRQICNLDELAHRYEKDRLSSSYQNLQSQHAAMLEHRNALHDMLVKWLLLFNGRKNTLYSLKAQLNEELNVFQQMFDDKLNEFETTTDTLLAQCSHDFKKLENELVALDCIPDLLTMVQDQGEKLKMLQDIDAQEKPKKVSQ